jgi:hypothetical protein
MTTYSNSCMDEVKILKYPFSKDWGGVTTTDICRIVDKLVGPVPLSTQAPHAVTSSNVELSSETKPTHHAQMQYRYL